MLLLDSRLRPPSQLGPETLVRIVSDVGVEGLAVGSEGTTRGDLEALLAAGGPVRIAGALLPPAPLAAHKRLPSLCGDDADERRAALALVEGVAAVLSTFDIHLATLNMGSVPLSTSLMAFRRACERRSLDDDSTDGPELRQEAFAERRGRSDRLLDNARFSLERLAGLADGLGLAFAVDLAGSPWGFPSPREALILMDEYHGAPLGLVWDRAKLAVLERLGFPQRTERLARLGAASLLSREHDAVGWDVGLLPGLGEPAPEHLASVELAPTAPTVLMGWPDTTDVELAEAVQAARQQQIAREERAREKEKKKEEAAEAARRATPSARG